VRIAIILFAVAALVFSLFTSDQLVLLARVSFAGTAMMGPLIILAILSDRPQGWFMIMMTGIGLVVFILSLSRVIPENIGSIRMDLFLMTTLAMCAAGNYVANRFILQKEN
jgi:solute:Na+ symporter, SSS family